MSVVTRGAWARPGTSLDFRTGNWRDERPVHHHFAAPCHTACPAGEDAQAWIAEAQRGDLESAFREIASRNPLPATTGRVCPHPCESACNRGLFDEPIAIHSLERFIGDEALRRGFALPMETDERGAVKVAIVGAGPGGLSAAWHLTRAGSKTVVLDAAVAPGGLLRSAIPMTRLPRSILDAELERLIGTGIELKLHSKLGRDFSLDELQSDFDAVFLAPGCQQPKTWNVQGAVPPGLHDGLELLKLWIDHGEVPTADRVVVHGGGNTAMDICRVVKRHGAREVHLVTASGLPGPETSPDDVINVVPRELTEGIEEGIRIHPHCTIQRLMLRGSRLVGVELASLRKLPRDTGGGYDRVSFSGTERVLEANMVIPCVGETVDRAGFARLLDGKAYFDADAEGRLAADARVFAGGDARGDRGTVAAAIGDGRVAAEAILRMHQSTSADAAPPRERIELNQINLNYYEPTPRAEISTVPPEQRTDDIEIEGGYAMPEFNSEAARCFSCGNCLACDNCWNLCPDNAVIKTVETAADGSNYVFDYEYCKGCGLCAHECPCGYIVMVPEPD